jgi:hypothetical protein
MGKEARRKAVMRGILRPLVLASTSVLLTASVGGVATAFAAVSSDQSTPSVHHGDHVSGVAKKKPGKPGGGGGGTVVSCTTPGGFTNNYKTNCHGIGRPVNETWIASGAFTAPSLPPMSFAAGANDYNSYNAQGQDGFYFSPDAKTWYDQGPIDVFPHSPNNAAGDPGLAINGGVVYYSSLFFNFARCAVGGVELLRRDAATGAWTVTQIAANSRSQFQDKPAIAVDSTHAYVSWTQFLSCSGVSPSPIKVAVFAPASSTTPSILSVPGSTFSQGSSIASDGAGGFWIAWEEFGSATATTGVIKLAHYNPAIPTPDHWTTDTPPTISQSTFTDLPSPLPGFAFRTDSFPALAVSTTGLPQVAWTSYDSVIGGPGRAYLYNGVGAPTRVSDSGGDQFFPAIASDGVSGVDVSFGQTNFPPTDSYDQLLVHVPAVGATTSSTVSSASSFPNNDAFFSGSFIGDYNGMTFSGTAHPIWTDIRGPGPFSGFEMDGMTYSP